MQEIPVRESSGRSFSDSLTDILSLKPVSRSSFAGATGCSMKRTTFRGPTTATDGRASGTYTGGCSKGTTTADSKHSALKTDRRRSKGQESGR